MREKETKKKLTKRKRKKKCSTHTQHQIHLWRIYFNCMFVIEEMNIFICVFSIKYRKRKNETKIHSQIARITLRS